jgi:hypothetical protein
MVRTNSSTNQSKIFELSKVRFNDVKTYGYKTGFVEVRVLNDNSKRVTEIWDGNDHADSKLFRVTDLIAVECEKGQEINRALAYKQRKADRLKQERQRHNNTVEDVNNSMSKTESLRDHPTVLSARLHVAQQDVFWPYVVHGTLKPFGEVIDYWRRVELQERGTPHSHYLINIATVAGGIQVAS